MKWISIITHTILFAGLIVLLGFTRMRHDEKKCTDYRVDLGVQEGSLITQGEVILLMESISDSIVGQSISQLPLYEIENKIEQQKNIENAEVYLTLSGRLKINVEQKEPIVRVKSANQKEFYMDEEGSIFDLSSNYTKRLLVANGNIKDSIDLSTINILAAHINSDPFLRSQIIQVYIKENKEIELIPRVGNHNILLGNINGYEEKFKKLKLFYSEGVKQTGWNNYKEINLKFKDQIVCVKK